MRYKIVKNGDTILITDSLRHASAVYNQTIYGAKSGDVIRVYYRKGPNLEWKMCRKDWI